MASGSGSSPTSSAYFRAQASVIVRIALAVMSMIALGIVGLGWGLGVPWGFTLGLVMAGVGGFGLLTAVMLLFAMSRQAD